jgi:DNA polymerase III subunit delta
MKIKPNQLASRLASKIYPVVLLSGDEAQLLQEAYQLTLACLAKKDYKVDQTFVISASTDWQIMIQAVANGSLFLEQRIFVLRMADGVFNKDLTHFIDCFLQHHANHHVLLIQMAKMAKKDQTTKCYKAIDHAGLIVQLWPLRGHELRCWIQNHARQMDLSCESSVWPVVEHATEGNLSATKQCLEKLQLIFGTTHVTANEARAHLFEQSEYQIYELMEHCLLGHTEKVLKLFKHYRKKENEINLLLWVVSRDLQLLYQLLQSQTREHVYQQNKIWPSRKQPYETALRRVDVGLLSNWMTCTADLDRCVKSEASYLVWDALLMLLICMVQSKPMLLEAS